MGQELTKYHRAYLDVAKRHGATLVRTRRFLAAYARDESREVMAFVDPMNGARVEVTDEIAAFARAVLAGPMSDADP